MPSAALAAGVACRQEARPGESGASSVRACQAQAAACLLRGRTGPVDLPLQFTNAMLGSRWNTGAAPPL